MDPRLKTSLDFVNVFAEALRDTFEVQASTVLTIRKVETLRPGPIENIEILASIGMKSSALSGLLAVYFPASTFLGVLNKMVGESYKEVSDEGADAAGELLNIAYARGRSKLNELGADFLPAIPTVIRGTRVVILHGGAPFVARVTADSEFGLVYMEVSLKGAG